MLLSAIAWIGTLAFSADFTYEDLTKLVQDQGLTRIEEVLPKLPEDMRKNYTLMRESRSAQCSSADAPRAILFGTHGKLTCTFNGDPSQCGNDTLECFQFREPDRKFDFRQIQFPSASNGLKSVSFSASGFSADGSHSCLGCHGLDPRPSWDNYNAWPGAYGGQDDLVVDADVEQQDYRRFVNIRYGHPRYQSLIQDAFIFAPYRDSNTDFDSAHRPNLRATEIFERLNAHRAARIVEEKLPAWERWAYVVGALHCVLNSAQQAALKKNGHDPSHDLALAKIFEDLGLQANDWSTEVIQDQSSYPDQPWEFQSGFSMLSENVAMALIQNRIQSGDKPFSEAVAKVLAYYSKTYLGEELALYSSLNAILLSPDYFGSGHLKNLSYFCPEAINLLLAEGKR